jgi:putative glutamine amidotransferase
VSQEHAPVVGLTTYRQTAAWGVWNTHADVLPAEYARAVEAAGGVPLLLPPVATAGAAERVVRAIDALVVSGGADVDPALYGATPHERTAGWRPDRDAWELALLTAADEVGLPVLGICRGMQIMAVHAGGTLDQHTPDLVGHETHSPGGDTYGDVEVEVEAGSRLADLIGSRAEVSCHHHQSVATHPGFTAVARADDGTVEAMEATGDRWCIGVQWHPETRVEVGLMAGLVDAARRRAGRTTSSP